MKVTPSSPLVVNTGFFVSPLRGANTECRTMRLRKRALLPSFAMKLFRRAGAALDSWLIVRFTHHGVQFTVLYAASRKRAPSASRGAPSEPRIADRARCTCEL